MDTELVTASGTAERDAAVEMGWADRWQETGDSGRR